MTRSRLFACAFFSSILFLAVLVPAGTSAQEPIRGRVTDATGAALPRVPVSAVDGAGATLTTTLTDAAGRFTLPSCTTCTVRVSLAGFRGEQLVVTAGRDLAFALDVAPIRESIVVTATRDDAPSSQVGASVTVIDAATLARRGDVLVADALRGTPGVTVVQNGGRGNVGSLFVRGGENSYTKVLLDGIPLNEPGGTFNFGGLTTGHLDRVELVRGAQSALFGSDAMAGVLQLITRQGVAGSRPELAGEISTGTYGTWQGSGRISGGTGRVTYSLHVGGDVTDNREPNNRYESRTSSASAQVRLSEQTRLRFVGRLEDADTGSPGQTAFGRPDLDASFSQRHLVGGVTLDRRGPEWTHRLTYALATSEQRSTNLQLDPAYTPTYGERAAPFEFFDFAYDSGSEFRRHHMSYQGDLRVTHGGALAGAELFTVAADWDGERGTLRDYLGGASISPSRNNLGLTAQHQHVSARLAVTTGIRLEDNASFGTSVVPRLSAMVLVRTGRGALGTTRVRANAGRGIKEPTMRQSFSLSPFDLGNPDLEAERSTTVDLGVEQRLFADRAKVEVVWFDSVFRNQISTRTVSFSPYTAQYFNVGRTEARGWEVSMELAPATGVRLIANHTIVDSEIIDSTSEFSEALAAGQWALRRPRHSGQAVLSVDRGRVTADLGARWTGRRNDSDFSSLVPALTSGDGYTLWHGQVSARLHERMVVFLRGDNLTNVEYMEPLGYPAWRRSLRAGLRVTF